MFNLKNGSCVFYGGIRAVMSACFSRSNGTHSKCLLWMAQ